MTVGLFVAILVKRCIKLPEAVFNWNKEFLRHSTLEPPGKRPEFLYLFFFLFPIYILFPFRVFCLFVLFL